MADALDDLPADVQRLVRGMLHGRTRGETIGILESIGTLAKLEPGMHWDTLADVTMSLFRAGVLRR